MTDSPRWCAVCDAYGNHHTDRHVSRGRAAMSTAREIIANAAREEINCGLTRLDVFGSIADRVLAALAADGIVLCRKEMRANLPFYEPVAEHTNEEKDTE